MQFSRFHSTDMGGLVNRLRVLPPFTQPCQPKRHSATGREREREKGPPWRKHCPPQSRPTWLTKERPCVRKPTWAQGLLGDMATSLQGRQAGGWRAKGGGQCIRSAQWPRCWAGGTCWRPAQATQTHPLRCWRPHLHTQHYAVCQWQGGDKAKRAPVYTSLLLHTCIIRQKPVSALQHVHSPGKARWPPSKTQRQKVERRAHTCDLRRDKWDETMDHSTVHAHHTHYCTAS
jgi:hypothetical protein